MFTMLRVSQHPHAARSSRRSVRTAAAASPTVLQRVRLGPDLEVAPIINGCWQQAGGHGAEVFSDLEGTLAAHVRQGFTSFDTADIYGQSEAILGTFNRRVQEAGGPPLQLLTKFCPDVYRARPTPASVEAAVRRSLGRLQVPSLDLVQLHWWDYAAPGLADTGLMLADLQAQGLIKCIGTTNMNVDALQQLLAAGVSLACNQAQFSLLDRRPLNGLLQLCEASGMKLLTYGSVGGGLLSDKFVQEPKTGPFGQGRYPPVDLNTSSLKMYMGVIKRFGGVDLWRRLLLVLRSVADRRGASVAAVALAWVRGQGGGGSVVPIVGVRGAAHVADNAAALSVALDAADLEAIQEVLADSSGPKGDCYSFERA